MKITYGKPSKHDGKITFDVEHKWGRYTSISDQMRMTMIRVLKKFDDASDFEFWEYNEEHEKSGVCAGRFLP